jgi:HSP20 family molecular chaperone IbpA
LDELASGTRAAPSPPAQEKEPLIDVIEDGEVIRVIVLLPGVRREDVRVTTAAGRLRVEVSSGDTVFTKEIQCKSAPSRIRVAASSERNSVVELVFARARGGPHR